MSSPTLRYIRHANQPPSDLGSPYRDILNVLGAEVKRVQEHVPKTRKTGSVYVGITGTPVPKLRIDMFSEYYKSISRIFLDGPPPCHCAT